MAFLKGVIRHGVDQIFGPLLRHCAAAVVVLPSRSLTGSANFSASAIALVTTVTARTPDKAEFVRAIAASRTPPWLVSGLESRGRRL
jgi:hypothetical protein